MKKKIIVIAVAASLMLSGVVSAASIWGSYKGNDIIRIVDISTNNTVAAKDVPAISYNGRTMIPISMLGQLGIDYQWDQTNKTVAIINRKNQTSTGSTSTKTTENILKTAMYKYIEDFGENLYFVKQGFDIEFVTKSLSGSSNSTSSSSLSNIITDYNTLISRKDVELFSQTDSEINVIINAYSNAIDTIKNIQAIVSSITANPSASTISTYQSYSSLAQGYIDSGNSLARNKYQFSLNESLK